MHGFY
jgi:hypothetical protein